MAVSSKTGGRFGVVATSPGCGVPSRVTGWESAPTLALAPVLERGGCVPERGGCRCRSGERGGVSKGRVMNVCDCGRVGLGAMSGIGRCTTMRSGVGGWSRVSSSIRGWGWGADGAWVDGVSEETPSAGAGAGEGLEMEESVELGSEVSLLLLPSAGEGGSGRCSEFGMLHRGQTQSRDLENGCEWRVRIWGGNNAAHQTRCERDCDVQGCKTLAFRRRVLDRTYSNGSRALEGEETLQADNG